MSCSYGDVMSGVLYLGDVMTGYHSDSYIISCDLKT